MILSSVGKHNVQVGTSIKFGQVTHPPLLLLYMALCTTRLRFPVNHAHCANHGLNSNPTL